MENLKNYNDFVENLLNLNFKIEFNMFKFTKFSDEEIEKIFQNDRQLKEKSQKILSDFKLLSGFIGCLMFVLIAYKELPYLIITILTTFATLILIVLSNYTKNQKIIYLFNNIQIFLLSVCSNFSGIIANLYFNTPQNDNYEQILRVMMYGFLSINFVVLVKLEANIFVCFFHSLLNLLSILISMIYSNTNHFYFFEGLTSIIYCLTFFFIRKVWDYRMRIIFAEKYKFEKLYAYSIDFILGLNAYHITIRNNELIYSDEKLKDLLKSLSEKFGDLKNSNNHTYKKEDFQDKKINFTIDPLIDKTEILLKDSEKNNYLKSFLKLLFIYKDNTENKNFDNNF